MAEFARHYHLDTQFYYGLGLIHDLMKQKEKDHELESLLSEEDKKESTLYVACDCVPSLLESSLQNQE